MRGHWPIVLLAVVAATMFVPSVASAASKQVFAGQLLRALPSAEETTSPRYSRAKFKHWTSSNGCTTRQKVLHQENLKRPKARCTSKAGRWRSAYDGLTITNASKLDIDHMIPLAEAWRSGAATKWDADTRKRFANDTTYLHSLIAVSASTNRSKGDKDPSSWMPPLESYRCAYAVRWTAVKYRWRLAVDQAERQTLKDAFVGCPRSVIRLKRPPRAKITNQKTAPKPPKPTKPKPPASGGGGGTDPRFRTCGDAQKAGYGPYYKGRDVEYDWYIDRDKDGIVCE